MSNFNPNEHMSQLQGKDYLEVKWRLVWLRSDAPDARIDTTLIQHDPGKLAVFKATVALPDGRSASGHGSETPNDFRDYLEKAETKAIGRALGALGYGTQFTDDFDTPVRADGSPSLADSPVHRPAPRTAPPAQRQAPPPPRPAPTPMRPPQVAGDPMGPKPASDKQWTLLTTLARQMGLITDDGDSTYLGDYIQERGNGETMDALTSRGASAVIDALKADLSGETFPF
jgi:hypothetical protein